MLLGGGVDLALYGHIHNAQRSCKLANYSCVGDETTEKRTAYSTLTYKHTTVRNSGDGRGIVHAVLGHAGLWLSQPAPGQPYNATHLPAWFHWATYEQHGYVRVNADRTRLELEFVNNPDGRIVDAVTLLKGAAVVV